MNLLFQARKQHWEKVYQTKRAEEVSWYKPDPKTSLDLILSLHPDPQEAIIDAGGGDSVLVDKLLALNFKNITVVDISAKALERAQQRLGDQAQVVEWVASDILDFDTEKRFDIWHDWATFHFLTEEKDIRKYAEVATRLIKPGGHLILATFSLEGPKQCSGLPVTGYCADSIAKVFAKDFVLIKSHQEDHVTPFQKKQNFLYALLHKKI